MDCSYEVESVDILCCSKSNFNQFLVVVITQILIKVGIRMKMGLDLHPVVIGLV